MENLTLHNNVDTFLMGSKSDLLDYQPKSGTAIAYDYAVKKRKNYKY